MCGVTTQLESLKPRRVHTGEPRLSDAARGHAKGHAVALVVASKVMAIVIELVGWAGALAVLLAYGLVSAERVSSRSWNYQLLNIGGAIGLVINSSWNGAIPSAVVNLIWIGIGVYALTASRTPTRAKPHP